jgi:hypothetical protein
VPRNLPDHCAPFDFPDQPLYRRRLRGREVLLELVVGRGTVATEQANPDGTAIMPFDMRPDF